MRLKHTQLPNQSKGFLPRETSSLPPERSSVRWYWVITPAYELTATLYDQCFNRMVFSLRDERPTLKGYDA